ncbi:MAG: hypothetical protein AB7K24_11145, partial [Gemmataceae bacterium]
MSLNGMDMNSSRLRALNGPAGIPPHALALEGKERELPMSISLASRYAEVGRAGQTVCRSQPFVVCD